MDRSDIFKDCLKTAMENIEILSLVEGVVYVASEFRRFNAPDVVITSLHWPS